MPDAILYPEGWPSSAPKATPPTDATTPDTHETIARDCDGYAYATRSASGSRAFSSVAARIRAVAARQTPEPVKPLTPAGDLDMAAWAVIANVSGGNWQEQSDEWQEAARLWRERFHASLPRPDAPPPVAVEADATFDLRTHLQRQRDWSEKTFGPGPRTKGVIDHIRKELREIEADPSDVKEWIDVVILGLDGAWRAGYSPLEIIYALAAKQERNEARVWPDWRTMSGDKAIEHVRGDDPKPTPPGDGEMPDCKCCLGYKLTADAFFEKAVALTIANNVLRETLAARTP